MPELPEVETVARLVRPKLVGRRIEGAHVEWPRTVGELGPDAFARAIEGTRVTRVWRRAKYIVVDLERARAPAGHLSIHLRMTGRLQVDRAGTETPPYTRVELPLDRRAVLRFIDVRKFGRVEYRANLDGAFDHLGPEPLDGSWDAEDFSRELRARRRQLKPLLLDQSFLCGLGNIYVDEALHRSGLHPLRRADRVPAPRARRLFAEIQATLAEAIEREGSSFDTFYRTPEGQPGAYQHQFRVYGRQGKPCKACGRRLVKIFVGQRGTHLCTRCQPAPRLL
ncbi:MAG: bifunctional DNA-formamidopyrimidine glycosylase/DNA-(apurinic or apyrimidinic site) lyase [Planctomycetes bacterium]|nr:bifunctional DNA-formamidopyrimidine glycosylase/DNA-(apurinic or apyrimidinic site) lyase [Planctomycetota bacterium]MCB9904543.1 bifunctional DNA-formamidopyrimidine glycosylase/DNA-(apurinic or apyrimidinic site) lyase [Planctomycetota bacterium]